MRPYLLGFAGVASLGASFLVNLPWLAPIGALLWLLGTAEWYTGSATEQLLSWRGGIGGVERRLLAHRERLEEAAPWIESFARLLARPVPSAYVASPKGDGTWQVRRAPREKGRADDAEAERLLSDLADLLTEKGLPLEDDLLRLAVNAAVEEVAYERFRRVVEGFLESDEADRASAAGREGLDRYVRAFARAATEQPSLGAQLEFLRRLLRERIGPEASAHLRAHAGDRDALAAAAHAAVAAELRRRRVTRLEASLLAGRETRGMNRLRLDWFLGRDGANRRVQQRLARERLRNELIPSLGFRVEPGNGGLGADWIASRWGERIAFHVRTQREPIGCGAVQALYTAIAFWGATGGVLIAVPSLTASAARLADRLGIEVWDEERLAEQIVRAPLLPVRALAREGKEEEKRGATG